MKEQTGLTWGRVGRSLLANALYFAGCGMASCAVFGFEQGAVVGGLAAWLLPVEPLAVRFTFVLNGLFGAGVGAIIGACVALPLFAVVGVLRGAAPLDSQRDELFRACAMARRAALVCGLAGLCSGPLLSFLTRVPLWAVGPLADSKGDLLFGGALSGLVAGNVAGLWLGALAPATIEAASVAINKKARDCRQHRRKNKVVGQ